jgi:hypothetical protein
MTEAYWYYHLRCVIFEIVTVGNCGGTVTAEAAR